MAGFFFFFFFFLIKTIKLIFMYLSAPFIMQNFKKILRVDPSYENVPFSSENGPFASTENFFRKTINISFMYLLVPFIVQNFKKIHRIIPELWGRAILGPKMIIAWLMPVFTVIYNALLHRWYTTTINF